MQAVILAGGVGSRLESMTGGRPKCLVEVGGRPIILHQLDALSDHGIGPVLMVVGYQHEAVREVVGQRVEYLVNERFKETNSLYSLWLAREWIKGDFVLLNSDLLFDPEILIDSGMTNVVVPEFNRVVPVWPYGLSATVVPK